MSLRPRSLAEAKAQKARASEKRRKRAARAEQRTAAAVVADLVERGVVTTAAALEEKLSPQSPKVTTTAPRTVKAPIEKAARWVSRRWLDGVKKGRCIVLVQVEGANDGIRQPCNEPGVDPHHVVTIGRRGDRFDLLAIPMCRRHHDAAHAGRLALSELHRMLGAYLCWQLPRVPKSVARVVVQQLLEGLED